MPVRPDDRTLRTVPTRPLGLRARLARRIRVEVALMRSTDDQARTARYLGTIGSIILAVGSTTAGALPVSGLLGAPPPDAWSTRAGIAVAYLGLALIVLAWLDLGSVARTRRISGRHMIGTLVLWATPIILAPPLYSRDVYSYLAQGAMFRDGMDPYRLGPSAYGGVLADNVSPIWQSTTAPYGPVFLAVAAAVMAASGGHVLLGILLMRLVIVVSCAASAYFIAVLAKKYGVDRGQALWLGALNPLVLGHFLSGVHNDALIVAGVLGAMVLVHRGRPFLATAVIAVAVLVKAPAVIALAFVVPAAGRRLGGPRPLLRGAAVVGIVAAVTMTAITASMNAWYGWVTALKDTTKIKNGLSVTTDIGMFLDLIGVNTARFLGADPETLMRTFGLGAATLTILVIMTRTRGRPLLGVGLSLVTVVLLGPVVHPWYLLWGLVPVAAATADRRIVAPLTVLSAALSAYCMPSGGGPTPDIVFGVLGIGMAVVVWRAARTTPTPDAASRPVTEAAGVA